MSATSDDQHLKYPIGRFVRPQTRLDAASRIDLIDQIAQLPADLRALVEPLAASDLDRPYRPGGWTVRQVVHHVPDSHMNGYIRMKLTVTEATPTIKPYTEARWAELGDVAVVPLGVSLTLLEALHLRWTAFLRTLTASDFERSFRHPEAGEMWLDVALAQYAWHGRHHTAHVRQALRKD